MASALAKATLGGGCFWCVESVFNSLRGVKSALSGYAGGTTVNPTYKEVCGGNTGHAEVVQVEFDPSVITYRQVLEVFFSVHDPTQLNRQGNDVGTQYRSVVFYHDDAQQHEAKRIIAELDQQKLFAAPIVTQVQPAPTFYRAEDYHQEYFANNPGQPYCAAVVAPKVSKFRAKWAHLLRGD
jgi:peptide-methionine (S)-S-oxide reductase